MCQSIFLPLCFADEKVMTSALLCDHIWKYGVFYSLVCKLHPLHLFTLKWRETTSFALTYLIVETWSLAQAEHNSYYFKSNLVMFPSSSTLKFLRKIKTQLIDFFLLKNIFFGEKSLPATIYTHSTPRISVEFRHTGENIIYFREKVVNFQVWKN